MSKFKISKYIEFDMAHRIPDHRSKCFKLHGHRYRVTAVCAAETLHHQGEQKGMVLDFGFLKEGMMEQIHDLCDHSTVWYMHDPLLAPLFLTHQPEVLMSPQDIEMLAGAGSRLMGAPLHDSLGTIMVNFVPTAENLAHWWFLLMDPIVAESSRGLAQLEAIVVHETPTSVAEYHRGSQHGE